MELPSPSAPVSHIYDGLRESDLVLPSGTGANAQVSIQSNPELLANLVVFHVNHQLLHHDLQHLHLGAVLPLQLSPESRLFVELKHFMTLIPTVQYSSLLFILGLLNSHLIITCINYLLFINLLNGFFKHYRQRSVPHVVDSRGGKVPFVISLVSNITIKYL